MLNDLKLFISRNQGNNLESSCREGLVHHDEAAPVCHPRDQLVQQMGERGPQQPGVPAPLAFTPQASQNQHSKFMLKETT